MIHLVSWNKQRKSRRHAHPHPHITSTHHFPHSHTLSPTNPPTYLLTTLHPFLIYNLSSLIFLTSTPSLVHPQSLPIPTHPPHDFLLFHSLGSGWVKPVQRVGNHSCKGDKLESLILRRLSVNTETSYYPPETPRQVAHHST